MSFLRIVFLIFGKVVSSEMTVHLRIEFFEVSLLLAVLSFGIGKIRASISTHTNSELMSAPSWPLSV